MSVKVYGSACASTRKSKKWFDKHKITYEYRDITRNPLKENEIHEILQLTETGTTEVLSTRSNIYKELTKEKQIDFDTLSLKKLYELMYQFPKLLRHPIIVGVNKLQVGFDEYNIRQFIPRDERRKMLSQTLSII